MRLTLEPTDQIQTWEGMPTRVWKGTDEHGTPVLAYIRSVSPQTHDAEANERFVKALQEIKVRRELVSFDMRMVVD